MRRYSGGGRKESILNKELTNVKTRPPLRSLFNFNHHGDIKLNHHMAIN